MVVGTSMCVYVHVYRCVHEYVHVYICVCMVYVCFVCMHDVCVFVCIACVCLPGWEDHSLEGRRDFLPDLVVLSPSWSLSLFNRVPNPSLQHLSACCTSANFNFKFMGSPWYRQP